MPGAEFVEWIERASLFVIHLDDEDRWFRYHHLFQELLKRLLHRRLSPDGIDDLHQRASRWFAATGRIEEALHHALEGGDEAAAMRLVAQHRHHMMNQEQWPRLERWLRMLPARSVETDPELLIAKAWLCENRGRPAETARFLDQIEPLLAAASSKEPTAWEGLRAEFDALSSFRHYLEGDAQQTVTHAERALEKLPTGADSVRSFAQCLLALGRQMAGELDRAYQGVYEALNEEAPHATGYHSRLLLTLCVVHWVAADLTGFRQAATQALKVGKDSDLQETASIASHSLGIRHYLRNELPEAAEYLTDVANNQNEPSTLNYSHNGFALGLNYLAQSQPEKANEMAEAVISRALDLGNAEMLKNAEAFQAELALREGNIAKAKQWAKNFDPQPFHPGYRFYVPQLTLARVLVAQDTAIARRQADNLLTQLHDFYGSIHNTRFLIDVLALQALRHDVSGDEVAALGALEHATTLAEPGGLIRPFLDLGPRMAGLLVRLVRRKTSGGFIGQLLAAFRDEERGKKQDGYDREIPLPPPSSTQPLVEPLRSREAEILALLAQRLSNKEIAEKLFLSPTTVKRYTITIYQKLGVNDRRDAVDKAQALGLLSDP